MFCWCWGAQVAPATHKNEDDRLLVDVNHQHILGTPPPLNPGPRFALLVAGYDDDASSTDPIKQVAAEQRIKSFRADVQRIQEALLKEGIPREAIDVLHADASTGEAQLKEAFARLHRKTGAAIDALVYLHYCGRSEAKILDSTSAGSDAGMGRSKSWKDVNTQQVLSIHQGLRPSVGEVVHQLTAGISPRVLAVLDCCGAGAGDSFLRYSYAPIEGQLVRKESTRKGAVDTKGEVIVVVNAPCKATGRHDQEQAGLNEARWMGQLTQSLAEQWEGFARTPLKSSMLQLTEALEARTRGAQRPLLLSSFALDGSEVALGSSWSPTTE